MGGKAHHDPHSFKEGYSGIPVFLIDKKNKDAFAAAGTIEGIQKFPTGSGAQWSTTPLLEQAGFQAVKGESKSNLADMLATGRFTTFGRGVDEIFFELEKYSGTHPDLMVEENVALYIPHPTYLFVSPKRPDLARRFETGLKDMIADGSFDNLFWKYFADDIRVSVLIKQAFVSRFCFA